jgi:hypothetical protein
MLLLTCVPWWRLSQFQFMPPFGLGLLRVMGVFKFICRGRRRTNIQALWDYCMYVDAMLCCRDLMQWYVPNQFFMLEWQLFPFFRFGIALQVEFIDLLLLSQNNNGCFLCDMLV